ncbi:MAG: hypothetical protein ACHQ2Z_00580, partial [Elusimicrobiota bacterium]
PGAPGGACAGAQPWASAAVAELIAASGAATTAPRLKSSTDRMMELLFSENARGALLPPAKRRELQAAYDAAHTSLYALQLRGTEAAADRIGGSLGLTSRRYAGRLGGVALSRGSGPAAPASPDGDAANYGAFAETMIQHRIAGLRRRWTSFYSRWVYTRDFIGKPAVADPTGLAADLTVLGMSGEFDAVGLGTYSHGQVFADSRRIFENHFGTLARDVEAREALEGLLRRVYDWNPDHIPTRFALAMTKHLEKAAALTEKGAVAYFKQAAPTDDKSAARSFRERDQEEVLRDFVAVMDETLREEATLGVPKRPILGVVLTGSYALLSARPGSDFDINLITADGGTQGAKAFMARVKTRWKARGRREEINVYPIALTPSAGLISRVHRGPHLVIAPDAGFLESPLAEEGRPAVEQGLFERPAPAGGGLRARLEPSARALMRGYESEPQAAKLVAHFPGLASRGFYRDAGRDLWDSGVPEVQDLYRRAAGALGLAGPERLFLTAENLPQDRARKSAFIAASFLTYNAALAAKLAHEADQGKTPIAFSAYSGESLGVLTAAVAAGAVSIEDGVKIAAFLLEAIDRVQNAESGEPQQVLTVENYFFNDILRKARERFGDFEVDVYRVVSDRRVKVYVPREARAKFDRMMTEMASPSEVTEEGGPTKEVFHSPKLSGVRAELARYLADAGVRFAPPRRPLVSNNGTGSIDTAQGVRDAILAMVDEPMESATTVDEIQALKPRPDLIVGLGLGGKSQEFFSNNTVFSVSFDGSGESFSALQRRLPRKHYYWSNPDTETYEIPSRPYNSALDDL